MAEHLVRPVEFVAEIEAMYQDGARVFLEVGPKAILSRLTAKILAGRPHLAIALDDGSGLRRPARRARRSSPVPGSPSTCGRCSTRGRAGSAIPTSWNR